MNQLQHLHMKLAEAQGSQQEAELKEQIAHQQVAITREQQSQIVRQNEFHKASMDARVQADLKASDQWAHRVTEATRLEAEAKSQIHQMKLNMTLERDENKEQIEQYKERLKAAEAKRAIVDDSEARAQRDAEQFKQILDQNADAAETAMNKRDERAQARETKLKNKLAAKEAELLERDAKIEALEHNRPTAQISTTVIPIQDAMEVG